MYRRNRTHILYGECASECVRIVTVRVNVRVTYLHRSAEAVFVSLHERISAPIREDDRVHLKLLNKRLIHLQHLHYSASLNCEDRYFLFRKSMNKGKDLNEKRLVPVFLTRGTTSIRRALGSRFLFLYHIPRPNILCVEFILETRL